MKIHFSILEYVWSNGSQGVTAKEVYDYVNKGGGSLSKAAIIGYLDVLCEMNVLKVSSETCRGGIRKRYFQITSKEKFIEKFIGNSIKEMKLKYPKETFTSLFNIILRETFTEISIKQGSFANITFPSNSLQESQVPGIWRLDNPLYI